MKFIIVGGVAGGATAAARMRRIDEQSEIILLEKGKYISYANCGLPYYIGGTIPNESQLFLQTPESFGKRFKVDVRVENEALSIDPSRKTLTIRNDEGNVYQESYDKLLLSPGASPVRPPLPGIDLEGIFTLRNVEDTQRIKEYATTRHIKNAIVVGGGFIGLEMAENLHRLGARVTVVEMAPQVMASVDFSIAAHVHQHLIQKGVKLYLGKAVERFEKTEDGLQVLLNSGERLDTDLVLLSIGVRPETRLAQSAGITLGPAKGIQVNEYLETSVKDIYAVGDAIEYPHPLTGKPYLNYLAGPANRQGRLVADNMVLGNTQKYEGALGTSIAKVFDLTVAATGLSARKLKEMEMEYATSTTHSSSHAGYYPGALPLTLKLVYHPQSGKLYGAQSVGYEGVDKRIDQIALVIKQGGTVYDLTRLEHAYAPPFSSAKDPVAIAGYVGGNVVSGVMPVITWRRMAQADPAKTFLLDVRTQAEFGFGSIAGAVNIPLDDLRERLAEIPADKEIYVFCAIGLRGYLALKILAGHGFKNVKNLTGGYKTYSTAMTPIRNRPVVDQTAAQTPVLSNDQQIARERTDVKTVKINACGLQCPGPVIQVKQAMDRMEPGDRLEMDATDAGFTRDAEAWCKTTGNRLISVKEDKGVYSVVLEKGRPNTCNPLNTCTDTGKTLILFSDDLDKALATFVLANGAAATGKKTTIFFTFWGLNVIKKTKKPKVKKDIFGKMFGFMLPSHSLKLHLSKMSMLGLGDKMMRHIMKRKHIESLESLRQQAIDAGVEFIACQMSTDVMGVKKEELLDNVTIGGVATYMERADKANVNLFI